MGTFLDCQHHQPWTALSEPFPPVNTPSFRHTNMDPGCVHANAFQYSPMQLEGLHQFGVGAQYKHAFPALLAPALYLSDFQGIHRLRHDVQYGHAFSLPLAPLARYDDVRSGRERHIAAAESTQPQFFQYPYPDEDYRRADPVHRTPPNPVNNSDASFNRRPTSPYNLQSAVAWVSAAPSNSAALDLRHTPTPSNVPSTMKKKRTSRTKIYVGGYDMTMANETQVKKTYRCRGYRRTGCRGYLEYRVLSGYDYANMVPHTCGQRNARVVDGDFDLHVVSADMKLVRREFYETAETIEISGLTRNEVKKRVHRARGEASGGDVLQRIKRAPLAFVQSDRPARDFSPGEKPDPAQPFLQFLHEWAEGPRFKRVVGRANPALMRLLVRERTQLFIDGTFRCVPRGFKQCVIVMARDTDSRCYVTVFYALASAKTHTTY
ncbi:hypothetical protein PybrP1_001348 [[Pythium] brassicae (nom. inval.)]|nr:hypothetical protein PybrP1_001348 [[Pythium] brassicae (nom. inval.)]